MELNTNLTGHNQQESAVKNERFVGECLNKIRER